MMQPVAQRVLTLSPELLVDLLQQAANQPSAPADAFVAADATRAPGLNRAAALGLSVAGTAMAGVCLAHLRPPIAIEARRANAMAWAVATPAVWIGAHLGTRYGGAADTLAAVGMGLVMFTALALALRHQAPVAGARRLLPGHLATAAVAGAAFGLVWHNTVLSSAALSTARA